MTCHSFSYQCNCTIAPRVLLLSVSSALIQSHEFSHRISLTVADLGDNVTLTCSVSGDQPRFLFWHKLNFGNMFQRVAVGYLDTTTLDYLFNSSRFNFTKLDDVYSLTIRNVRKEDEATYLCQGGSSISMVFFNGTLLAVNDPKNQKKSVYVKQSPDVESVQLGNSVTLRCSLVYKKEENKSRCPGERRVHWFRAGSESNPGIIYTDSTCSDGQEGRSCDYRLSKTIRESSDAGTYYCAVATCGQILFGEGTQVETNMIPKLATVSTFDQQMSHRENTTFTKSSALEELNGHQNHHDQLLSLQT
ncbi:uncharacterized protein LOC103375011 [Stegastes partitus]|uniref:Uncharacterized protein LOC103375011 n=1 Tax=Stegastes partitus TaxID=144197 RepID=A0A9Y4NTY3_9TELE|nr:PREDICTED: uncharacterized protein LOC103375011 [Stegastes partitus]